MLDLLRLVFERKKAMSGTQRLSLNCRGEERDSIPTDDGRTE